ncbi:hypothetical protein M5689_021272 [Euphorbia peplus]|nr:hypothetical protein M5689_021272 [Euphorbia peplus]
MKLVFLVWLLIICAHFLPNLAFEAKPISKDGDLFTYPHANHVSESYGTEGNKDGILEGSIKKSIGPHGTNSNLVHRPNQKSGAAFQYPAAFLYLAFCLLFFFHGL